jgi:hypothetical protein
MITKPALQKIFKRILYIEKEEQHTMKTLKRINLTRKVKANEDWKRIKHYKSNKMTGVITHLSVITDC